MGRIDRNVYDANLRLLEVELEMAEFPDDVTWDLRQEMPWCWRANFAVGFETGAFNGPKKGVLFFQQMRVNSLYRWSAFDLELPGDSGAMVERCRFERVEELAVGLREAVNLMMGRPVFRDYLRDPEGRGYWLELVQGENGYEVCRSASEFLVETALDTGMFRRRLGAAECLELAEALYKGDRVQVDVNGKTVFVEVDLYNARLVLTNAAGKPAKLNWWELFMRRG